MAVAHCLSGTEGHCARLCSDQSVPLRTFVAGDPNAPDLEDAEATTVLEFGDDLSPQPPVELVLTLPGPSKTQSSSMPTQVVGASIRSMVALSPMVFEWLKYALDRRHEAKLPARGHLERAAGQPVEPLDAGALELLREEGAGKRPAILIGFHWLEHGGAEKLAFDTVDWALAAGFRVIVVTAHNAEHRLADRLPDSPDVVFARMDRYVPHKRTSEFLRNMVLRENVRALHIHHCPPLLEALPAIRDVAPDVHTISSTHIIEYKGGGYVYASARYGEYIDTQHVISRQLGDVLRAQLGSDEGIVLGRILEGNAAGVESSRFPSSLSNRPLRVLFVGRMSYQKRPVLVAMIMRSLARWSKSKGISLSFDVVGEGPYLPVFKGLLRRFGLEGVSSLHPANADVPALMERADFLLLPSANEGLALVCYEAIEAGTIPISTDVGAQSEVIPAELLVDRNPTRALKSTTDIVDRLVGDDQFYQKAVSGLLARYDDARSDPTAHEALSEIYRRVLASGEKNGQA